MPKLERSLKRFASDFGDTNAQAVVRWSVQTCRELAFETQPFGKRNPRKTQELSIVADAYRVVFTYRGSLTSAQKKSRRAITSADQLLGWMDTNRGKNNRTRNLPKGERKICSLATLRKAVRIRMKNAGIAKGGFIGAGKAIARAQTGDGKISIGRNLFGYAQKHTSFGDATRPRSGFNPSATLKNKASHTAKEYVISKGKIDKAVSFGLSKTVKWYAKTLRSLDRKKS